MIGLLAVAAAAPIVVAGCGSSDPAQSNRQAGGLSSLDVVGVVCNMTDQVLETTMTSTKPGESPAQLAKGDCISSRPQDAGGDSQFSTSLGDQCGVKATIVFPGDATTPPEQVRIGFYSLGWGYQGITLVKSWISCNSPAGNTDLRTEPGQSKVITIAGLPVLLQQWPEGAYAQVGITIFPKGTPTAEMK